MSFNVYKLERKWIIVEVLKAVIISGGLSLLFYDSLAGIIITAPIGIVIWLGDKKKHFQNINKKIQGEFKDFILLMSGNLNAGYSLENSFIHSCEEYDRASKGKALISGELKKIVNGLSCNKKMEDMLYDFGIRTKVSEIEDFASLIITAKQYGGNIIKLINETANNLAEKHLVEGEIETLISAKKMEGKIMLLSPVLIVMYMKLTNGSYMDIFYQSAIGRCVMTVCLLLSVFAGAIISKITNIEV